MKSLKTLFFGDLGASGIQGLISENVGGISPGTHLYFDEVPPRYKKQQRKNVTIPGKTRFNTIAAGL